MKYQYLNWEIITSLYVDLNHKRQQIEAHDHFLKQYDFFNLKF